MTTCHIAVINVSPRYLRFTKVRFMRATVVNRKVWEIWLDIFQVPGKARFSLFSACSSCFCTVSVVGENMFLHARNSCC